MWCLCGALDLVGGYSDCNDKKIGDEYVGDEGTGVGRSDSDDNAPGDDGASDEGVLHIVYCAHWFVSDAGHCQQLEGLCQILPAVFRLF